MSLTYDKLASISAGLGIDISELFVPEAASARGAIFNGRRSFTAAGQGQEINTDNYSHLYPAADFLNKRFVPLIAELHAHTVEEFGEMIRHPGEEYAYVLEGVVQFCSELYAPLTMRKGDSLYFDSGMGHAYLKADPSICRVLSICSSPESKLIEGLQRDGETKSAHGNRRNTKR